MDRLPGTTNSTDEISATEFQEKLYNWFKEQGLISELRGHLRMQMVNAFQDGSVNISNNRQFSASPKIQAINTLIADFLLQQCRTYTLSVFVTEVPAIGQMFTQFSQSQLKRTLEIGNRFTPHDVEDILQTLGLMPESDLGSHAVALYESSNTVSQARESLLLCIVRALTTFINRNPKEHSSMRVEKVEPPVPIPVDNLMNAPRIKNMIGDEWNLTVDDAGMDTNLKLCPITCLQEYMKRVHEEELCKVREEEAEKYRMLLEEKQKELEKKELKEIQLREWEKTVQNEFNERERDLSQLASQLRKQHSELTEKLLFLEIESQDIKKREKLLREDHERETHELKLKESALEIEREKLNDAYEQLSTTENNCKIQNTSSDKELTSNTNYLAKSEIDFLHRIQEQYSTLCKLISNPKIVNSNQAVCTVDSATNTNLDACQNDSAFNRNVQKTAKEDKGLQTSNLFVEPTIESELLNRTEAEKRELNERVAQQRQRIDELTIRAAELSNQLQDAQIALQLVGPQQQMAITTPPLTAPPTLNLRPRPNWPPHIGSGEETSFSAMRPTSPPVQPFNNHDNAGGYRHGRLNDFGSGHRNLEARRRARRSTVLSPNRVNISLSSDDSSTTTEDMIQEARIRLRQLAQESNSVQQQYNDFQNRSTRIASPIVFHPEQATMENPFNGFRQQTFAASYPSHMTPSFRMNTQMFTSRLGNLSMSRPIIGSFISRFDQRDNNLFSPRVHHGRIIDELHDCLQSRDVSDSRRNPIYTPLIRTLSPTDVITETDEPHSSLKKRVVRNTLNSHSNGEKSGKPTDKVSVNPEVSESNKYIFTSDYSKNFITKRTDLTFSKGNDTNRKKTVKFQQQNLLFCSKYRDQKVNDREKPESDITSDDEDRSDQDRYMNHSIPSTSATIGNFTSDEDQQLEQNVKTQSNNDDDGSLDNNSTNEQNKQEYKSEFSTMNNDKLILKKSNSEQNLRENRSKESIHEKKISSVDNNVLESQNSDDSFSVEILLQRSLKTSLSSEPVLTESTPNTIQPTKSDDSVNTLYKLLPQINVTQSLPTQNAILSSDVDKEFSVQDLDRNSNGIVLTDYNSAVVSCESSRSIQSSSTEKKSSADVYDNDAENAGNALNDVVLDCEVIKNAITTAITNNNSDDNLDNKSNAGDKNISTDNKMNVFDVNEKVPFQNNTFALDIPATVENQRPDLRTDETEDNPKISWREPGDGSDMVSESDEPVSAGSHESSSSFW